MRSMTAHDNTLDSYSATEVSCIVFLPSPVCLWQLLCVPECQTKKNYFTSSDPHHDMLGGGCQVRVVIENMMGRMENLRTLISGFLGLVILVR